jgi:hypothetical protein
MSQKIGGGQARISEASSIDRRSVRMNAIDSKAPRKRRESRCVIERNLRLYAIDDDFTLVSIGKGKEERQ